MCGFVSPDCSFRVILSALNLTVWCYWASEQLWGCAPLDAIDAVIQKGLELRVQPNVLASLERMAKKAGIWLAEAKQELNKINPVPFDMERIKQLRDEAQDVPVKLPEERQLNAMLEDGGARYCICRRPADGGFMIGCDTCEEWFHGHCVHVPTIIGEKLESYECPGCTEKRGGVYAYARTPILTEEDEDPEDEEEREESAFKNEYLSSLWPPSQVLRTDGTHRRYL